MTRPAIPADVLAGWARAPFTGSGSGVTHEVLTRGAGPGVVLVPEIPGATPAVMALADRLVGAGFRVAVASRPTKLGRGRACSSRSGIRISSRDW